MAFLLATDPRPKGARGPTPLREFLFWRWTNNGTVNYRCVIDFRLVCGVLEEPDRLTVRLLLQSGDEFLVYGSYDDVAAHWAAVKGEGVWPVYSDGDVASHRRPIEGVDGLPPQV